MKQENTERSKAKVAKKRPKEPEPKNMRKTPTRIAVARPSSAPHLSEVLAGGVTKGDVSDQAGAPVSARYRVMQRAVYSLIEAGKLVTQASIAREVGIRRQNVWKFFRRHPTFLAWLNTEMTGENQHLYGMLARKHFTLGMMGSVPSGEFFVKLTSGHYIRPLGESNVAGAATAMAQINLLIPRPEMPQPAAAKAEKAASVLTLPATPAIPVLEVRS